MDALFTGILKDLFFRLRITVIDQVDEFGYRFIQEITAADFGNIIANRIGNIPQAFQGIPGQVNLSFDRGVTQFRT